ncbi:hypothetical protein [Halomonas sp. 18071143]|uniref:hypothetical protein n=1 Tax=Halomonas sp. 18071143 TaxID=2855441 RepID=UPI00210A0C37|nr:hypothetical protein [Halomonas sp. 18071143]
MRDEEKYTNTEEQLLYLQKLLNDEDTLALHELFNELDFLAIARTLESFPAKTRDPRPETSYGTTFPKPSLVRCWRKSTKTSAPTTSKT